MFLEAGGNWKEVEVKVRRWHEAKKVRKSEFQECTRAMLEKQYHWDKPGAQVVLDACAHAPWFSAFYCGFLMPAC